MFEIRKNSMVTLTYDLYVDDENGRIIEHVPESQPLEFLYGAGVMLPEFELHLAGLREGENFTIKLNKNDAYGDVNADAIVELPIQFFLVDGKFNSELVKEGNMVPMMSSNGQRLNGLVLEVGNEIIKMDFNHPLAGEDLFFVGKILIVREASDEELNRYSSGGRCGCTHNCSHESNCQCDSDDSRSGCSC
ncbi:MAG: FKBP-type peptidyl-prolyl cis-trans isomerase [Bacteroidales bacterium]|nr:FKBP-type peptidyl-prolyl cis-trans isomerase [Bacteroidales bacterium]